MRLFLVWLVTVCACAPLSEEERYERENQLILAKEEFSRRAEYCEQMGGSMSMQQTSKLRAPSLVDYRSAACVSH